MLTEFGLPILGLRRSSLTAILAGDAYINPERRLSDPPDPDYCMRDAFIVRAREP